MSSLRLSLLVFLLCTPAVLHAQASPPPDPDSIKARSLFDKGMAHFHLEEYPQAIDKWEEGFRVKPVAEFLYNIAQAYRLSRQADKAVSFYRKYLHMRPDAPNRVEVERHIRELSRVVDEQNKVASAPPRGMINPGSHEGEPPAPAPAPPAASPPPVDTSATSAPPASTSSTGTGADLTASHTNDVPITKRKWFWPVVAGGAAVVVAAVVVGVVVGTRSSTKTLPMVTF